MVIKKKRKKEKQRKNKTNIKDGVRGIFKPRGETGLRNDPFGKSGIEGQEKKPLKETQERGDGVGGTLIKNRPHGTAKTLTGPP